MARMSFGRRVELMRRVRELARRMEFLEASREPGRKDGRGAAAGGNRPALPASGAFGRSRVFCWMAKRRHRAFSPSRPGGIVPGSAGGGQGRNGPHRVRTKKLIVAFHFQFSSQAGWRCDVCRRTGLEKKRRCGWLPVSTRIAREAGLGARARIHKHVPQVRDQRRERVSGGGVFRPAAPGSNSTGSLERQTG